MLMISGCTSESKFVFNDCVRINKGFFQFCFGRVTSYDSYHDTYGLDDVRCLNNKSLEKFTLFGKIPSDMLSKFDSCWDNK